MSAVILIVLLRVRVNHDADPKRCAAGVIVPGVVVEYRCVPEKILRVQRGRSCVVGRRLAERIREAERRLVAARGRGIGLVGPRRVVDRKRAEGFVDVQPLQPIATQIEQRPRVCRLPAVVPGSGGVDPRAVLRLVRLERRRDGGVNQHVERGRLCTVWIGHIHRNVMVAACAGSRACRFGGRASVAA